MSTANTKFPLAGLPRELQDKVWETIVGIDGPPLMQCVELDFLDGLEGPSAENEFPQWFRGNHSPSASPPTDLDTGSETASASYYLYAADGAASTTVGRDALEHFYRVLENKPHDDLVGIQAEAHPVHGQHAVVKKASVWVNTKRDVLVIQTPSHLPKGRSENPEYALRVHWFSLTGLNVHGQPWSVRSEFRPLPFFGLDRLEKMAIDFQVETARGSVYESCRLEVCNFLRRAYLREIYFTPRAQRKFCFGCTGGLLDGFDKKVREGNMTPDRFFRSLVRIFPDHPMDPGSIIGLDEEGTFKCQGCGLETRCTHGRMPDMAQGLPHDHSHSCWEPTCHAWHQPSITTDIETLLFGRMPALKDFYIIDNTVKFHNHAWSVLKGPYESFEGYKCKFVEVNPRAWAWDLSGFDTMSVSDGVYPFHSFALADKFRTRAYQNACVRHALRLMEEERANRDPYDAPDSDDAEFEDYIAELESQDLADKQKRLPDNKFPLSEALYVRDVDQNQLLELQGQRMRKSRTLEGTWPESLQPVKVKVMARVEPGDYWRLQ